MFGDSAFETVITEYDEGTLIIDFLDAGTQRLFWRGTGTRRINHSSSPAKISRYDQQMGFRNPEAVPAEEKGQSAGTCWVFYVAESGDAGSTAGITDQISCFFG